MNTCPKCKSRKTHMNKYESFDCLKCGTSFDIPNND